MRGAEVPLKLPPSPKYPSTPSTEKRQRGVLPARNPKALNSPFPITLFSLTHIFLDGDVPELFDFFGGEWGRGDLVRCQRETHLHSCYSGARIS